MVPRMQTPLSEWNISPLHWAAFEGNYERVRQLATPTTVSAADGRTGKIPMHWAALGGSPTVILTLIENGSAIDTADRNGETPLRDALRSKDVTFATAIVLMANGADPNARMGSSRYPLIHAAVWINDTSASDAIRLLRSGSADPSAKDENPPRERQAHQVTALHLAMTSDPNYVHSLVYALTDRQGYLDSSPADPRIVDTLGMTPLHWAAGCIIEVANDPRVLDAALVAGSAVLDKAEFSAWIGIWDIDGHTASDCARDFGRDTTKIHEDAWHTGRFAANNP